MAGNYAFMAYDPEAADVILDLLRAINITMAGNHVELTNMFRSMTYEDVRPTIVPDPVQISPEEIGFWNSVKLTLFIAWMTFLIVFILALFLTKFISIFRETQDEFARVHRLTEREEQVEQHEAEIKQSDQCEQCAAKKLARQEQRAENERKVLEHLNERSKQLVALITQSEKRDAERARKLKEEAKEEIKGETGEVREEDDDA